MNVYLYFQIYKLYLIYLIIFGLFSSPNSSQIYPYVTLSQLDVLLFGLKKKKKNILTPVYPFNYTQRGEFTQWSMVKLPEVIPLKKTDSSLPQLHQLPTAPQGWKMMDPLPSHVRMLAGMTSCRLHTSNSSCRELMRTADKCTSQCYFWIALAVFWSLFYTINFLCNTAADLK